jgi:hypothetical protein
MIVHTANGLTYEPDQVKRGVLHCLEQFYGQPYGWVSCAEIASIAGMKRARVANYLSRQKVQPKNRYVEWRSHRPMPRGYGDVYRITRRGLAWLELDYEARGAQTCC